MPPKSRRQQDAASTPPSAAPTEDIEVFTGGTTPSLDSVESEAVGAAPSSTADIAFFFTPKEKNSSVKRFCVVCRDKHQGMDDPSKWSGPSYSYAMTSSNSTLRGHLERCHKERYHAEANKSGWVNHLSPAYKDMRKAATQNAQAASRIPFSTEALVDHLVRFVVANDQSINVIESRQFRDLLLFLRPDMNDDEVPHRTKLRAAIIETWQASFAQIKVEITSALGCPSFTMDIWSARSRASYLAITAHYVRYRDPQKKESIELKSQLIAFHKLGGKHSGVRIAQTVTHLLNRVGVDPAGNGHWTCDNAGNNGTFIEEFIRVHRPDLPSPRQLLVACFPHVVHLIAGSIIKVLDVELVTDQSADGEEGTSERTEEDEADEADSTSTQRRPKKRTLLVKIRGFIRSLRSSSQRVEAFDGLILKGNGAGWWTTADNKPFEIKPRKLLRDVKTRWDSTFEMLQRLFSMKQAVDAVFQSSLEEFKDLKKFAMSAQEWKKVEQFIAILRHLHKVQHLMAKQKLPVLAGAIPVFERLMSKLEALAQKEELSAAIEAGLATAYKYYRKMDTTDAYVIAMFVHPSYRMSHIEKYWDDKYMNKARKTIKALMHSYRNKGLVDLPNPSAPPRPARSANTNLGFVNYLVRTQYDDDDDDLDAGVSSDGETTQTSDAPTTVDEEYNRWVTSSRPDLSIDQLKFWEINSTAFPTIFRIAMDYLPIQASSVPAERVFSSSAETDTLRRNRISPILMEALQMVKFSINHEESLDFAGNYVTPVEEFTQLDGRADLFGRDLLAELTSVRPERREDVMDNVIRAIA